MGEDKDIAEDDMVDTATTNVSSKSGVNLHLQVVIRDKYAREDLKVISWKKKTPLPSLADLKSYSYQEIGREGSYIYIIENGIDPGAPVRSPSPTICTLLHANQSDR